MSKIHHSKSINYALMGGEVKHTSLYISQGAWSFLKDEADARGMSVSLFLDCVISALISMGFDFSQTTADIFNGAETIARAARDCTEYYKHNP